jgi:uncharacterized membrane protein
VAYALSFGVQSAVEADFHEVAFAAPLLALAGAAYVDRRYSAVVWWSVPLLLVKEDMGLTVAVVGFVLNLAIGFALHTIFRDTVTVSAGPVRFDAPVLASVDPWALALCAAAVVAVLRFKLGVIPTLLANPSSAARYDECYGLWRRLGDSLTEISHALAVGSAT